MTTRATSKQTTTPKPATGANRSTRRKAAKSTPPQMPPGVVNNLTAVPEMPPGHQLPDDAMPPEVQNLFIEALFWKQKYFELQQHMNQVVGMLSRPAAGPAEMANMLGHGGQQGT